MILASIDNVAAQTVKDVILILLSLLTAAALIRNFFRKDTRTISPDPLRVQGVEKLATKEDLENHAAWDREEHDKLFRKIGGVERGANERLDKHLALMQKSAEDGREKLHERINEVLKAVSRLEGKMEERQ